MQLLRIVSCVVIITALTLPTSSVGEEQVRQRSKKISTKQEKEPVTLDDILRGTLSAAGFGGSWVPGSGDTLRVISGNNVWEYNVATGDNRTVVEATVFEDRFGQQALGLKFSADNQFILIEHSRTQLWRHSYIAKYDVYNISSGQFSIVQPKGFEGQPQQELQLALWSPSGNSIAFVFRNNIFYKPTPAVNAEQITLDGDDAMFNGISDWVYEEEMFGSPTAMWFSKDSSSLVFVKFNDSTVPFYQWPVYGRPGEWESAYPIYEPLRYPKSGYENPIVSVNVVKLSNPTVYRPVEYPADQDKNVQYYIAKLTWTTGSHFILETLNRHQNLSVWNLCNSDNFTCSEIYGFAQNSPAGWIDAHTLTVSNDGSKFLAVAPVRQSDGRSYTHVILLSTSGKQSQFTPKTSGLFHVDSINGWDEQNNKIYFSAAGYHPEEANQTNPGEKHVYFVNAEGTDSSITCVSCPLKTGANEQCDVHSFTFSATFEYYMHSCQGPGVPETTTKRTSDNHVVMMWADNAALREKLANKLMPTTKDVEVDLPGGFKGRARLYLPPQFDSSKQYPLLIDVYAGPDNQNVNQNFKINWGTYLTSSQGIIYGYIDGRGSGRQSIDQTFALYRNLGSVEVEDQIAITKHLVDTEGYIDPNRTAIWGWSYGGYATAMALGKDSTNVFQCGISVAPVTSWLYYDTIYTERFMGLPTAEDNWSNYNASSVMNHVDNFKTHQFFLIHGNADDNVHYQQSMMLARVLEQNDVMFNQLSYPDENHGIGGPGMRRHLYHSIERFLLKDCFGSFTPSAKRSGGSPLQSNASLLYAAITVIFSLYQRL